MSPRNNGTRFTSRGLRTGVPADALREGEFPYLLNVRGNTRSELVTRDGFLPFSPVFDVGAPVQAIAAYTTAAGALRYVAKAGSAVYVSGVPGTSDTGYSLLVPSMLPTAPQPVPSAPWIYVSDALQYRKLSAPSATNVVTAQNVGIKEPQTAPDAYIADVLLGSIGGLNWVDPASTWGHSGTAGAVTTNNPTGRSTDTIVSFITDPVAGSTAFSVQVTGAIEYQKEELVQQGANPATLTRLIDVYAPIPTGIDIQSIQYLSGTTGQCVVVPALQAPGPGSVEESLFAQQVIANLRRGALVTIGAEVCYVLDVETGPLGTICFTTSTTGAHTAADALGGVPAVRWLNVLPVASAALNSGDWTFSSGSGIGTIQIPVWTNFFTSLGASFQPDDYLHFSVNVDNLNNLTELKILFNVTAGAYANFDEDAYYYTMRPSDIQAGVANTLTQLGVTQLYAQRELIQQETGATPSAQSIPGNSAWSEISIPLRMLTRIGNDQSRTLNDAHGIQFLVNATGTVNIAISSITIHGGGQVDVGTLGQPYIYRIRPRSSVTGAKGNPSPSTRYGLSPVRETNNVVLPTVAYDPQFDLWDIFRLGGTLDTFRLSGTVTVGTTPFTDNYSDTAIAQSEVLEFDNLQPWPTIDYPLSIANGVTVNGYLVTPFHNSVQQSVFQCTIPRYLPGLTFVELLGRPPTRSRRPAYHRRMRPERYDRDDDSHRERWRGHQRISLGQRSHEPSLGKPEFASVSMGAIG